MDGSAGAPVRVIEAAPVRKAIRPGFRTERYRYHLFRVLAPKVLVVEDDARLAQLYCTALFMRGIDCAKARDGYTALQSVEQQRPSLIVLDLNLPTVDGWAVLSELAANPLTSNIPVIVVTGVEPKPDLPHALVVLCKPCDPSHLAQIVVDHLPAHR